MAPVSRFIPVLFIFTRLLLNTADARTIKVHNPKIDVVLMYDQKRTMEKFQNDIMWNDMKDWIKRYYSSGRDETRFAVIGCVDNQVALKLDDLLKDNVNDKAKKTIDKTEEVRIKFGDTEDVDLCIAKIADEIFTSGDRVDAPNIVIFVNDCQNKEGHPGDGSYRFNKKCEKWLWVCVKGGGYSDDDIALWLEGKRELVMNYTDKASFIARLDQLFSDYLIDKEVWDCEWDKNGSVTPCELQENGACVKTVYPKIVKEAGPEDDVEFYVNACSRAVPANESVNCDPKQCLTPVTTTTMPSTTTTTISSTIRATITSTREGRTTTTESTTGRTTRTESTTGRTTESVPKTTPRLVPKDSEKTNPNPGGRAEEGNDSSTGVVIACLIVLVLLIILIIVVVVVVYRKKKKSTVAKIRVVNRKGKEQDILVSIDPSDESTTRSISLVTTSQSAKPTARKKHSVIKRQTGLKKL